MPILLGVFAGALAVMFAVLPEPTGTTAPTPNMLPGTLVATGLMFAWAGIGARKLTSAAGRVRVRGVFRRVDVSDAAAFGYEVRSSGRSATLVVYLTEGGAKHDVLSFLPFGTRRGDKLVVRLASVLAVRPSPAAHAVARADHDARVAAQRTVDSYYRGKGGRILDLRARRGRHLRARHDDRDDAVPSLITRLPASSSFSSSASRLRRRTTRRPCRRRRR